MYHRRTLGRFRARGGVLAVVPAFLVLTLHILAPHSYAAGESEDSFFAAGRTIGSFCAELWAAQNETDLNAQVYSLKWDVDRLDSLLNMEITSTEVETNRLRAELATAQPRADDKLAEAIWNWGQTGGEIGIANAAEAAAAIGSSLEAEGLDATVIQLQRQLAEQELELTRFRVDAALVAPVLVGISACVADQRAYLRGRSGPDPGVAEVVVEPPPANTAPTGMVGVWTVDCGDGFVLSGPLRMTVQVNGKVEGGIENEGGEGVMPLHGVLDASGRLTAEAVVVEMFNTIAFDGTLERVNGEFRGQGSATMHDVNGPPCSGRWFVPVPPV